MTEERDMPPSMGEDDGFANTPLDRVLAQAGLGSWQMDRRSRLCTGNSAFFRLLGLPQASRATSVAFLLDRLAPEGRAALESLLLGTGSPERPVTVETLATADSRPLSWTGCAAEEDPDTIVGILRETAALPASTGTEERMRLAQKIAGIETFDWTISADLGQRENGTGGRHGLHQGAFGGAYEDWISRIHAEDLQDAVACVETALETGHLDGEWRILRTDGTTIWVVVRARVETDNSGRPQRMTGAQIDVTERVHDEQSVRALITQLDDKIDELRAQITARRRK